MSTKQHESRAVGLGAMSLWDVFAAAALAGGLSPTKAAKVADEMLKLSMEDEEQEKPHD